MIKIWGKIISKEKIAKSAIIEVDEENTSFFEMLRDLSASLHIPTPVLLDKHVHDFNLFHICEFSAGDFIEPVIFDRFMLELMRGN